MLIGILKLNLKKFAPVHLIVCQIIIIVMSQIVILPHLLLRLYWDKWADDQLKAIKDQTFMIP